MKIDPWIAYNIDLHGYNGLRQSHIDRVADEIRRTGITDIDYATFERCCREASVEPSCFEDSDLQRLLDTLNRRR